ncbi:1-deoxy-D-xylulose-5-phosphate reductoisomerase [Rubinisphaera margarita]|uniref:1-deoxy-D-xylulose-5-phosphate reductoisomerase n=1 Tax=Rubinisphaera margarita TaxID=2909586 RepID=UPI001EE842F4|nr:1-deoxy-D-xylulose-5-phosphate reductoisomerase [Rubinisphaera margarita]MCG6156768.1 1-deoxy-D-xylulose-5-phosphate reductoisomerase [Rubinisphaera margarita]
MNQIALLGATGSIGTSCLDVARVHGDAVQVFAVSANGSWQKLAKICHEFQPKIAILADESCRPNVKFDEFPAGTEVRFGAEALCEVAADDRVDTVVAAIVGAAGLGSSHAAVKAGKRVAIANKETLVVAGPIIMQAAAESGSELIPVDSEHSAIFQALLAGRKEDVAQIVLTSSGGPFREKSRDEIASAGPKAALKHPTWDMGPKITIDSATLMNKALEVIEARWLFNLQAEQIDVVVHPQSIVHSFVEYRDGSVIAQLSPPDMRLPIQYALSYPERWEAVAPRFDFKSAQSLDFVPPDLERFPALQLGFDVARQGGTSGAVLNAANEIAVSRYLQEELSFYDIANVCREVLSRHTFHASPSLEELVALDDWARKETTQWQP